ncbi:MAG: hypothetical protein ABI806_00460 [Candidatus Solibacter sp.]
MGRVSALYPLARAHPYFQAEHAILLYLGMPLAAVSSFALFLAPGFCLASAFRRTGRLPERILLSFGASLALTLVLGTCLKLALGTPLSDDTFVACWAVAFLASAGFCAFRIHSGQAQIISPDVMEIRRLALMAVASALAVAILTPKLFWENLNIDGTEAFEFGRSLSRFVLPNWDIQGGAFGFYHNFVLFAYPNHWFLALFGSLEGSVRLTFVFYLALMFAALILLIEHGLERGLRLREELTLCLGLALYTVLQAYNTTYDPFFADIAEPGATDTLVMVCFLAALYFLWSERMRWFVFFVVATYLSTVGGSALLLALGASLLTVPAAKKYAYLRCLAVVGVCCGLFGLLHETLYNYFVLKGAKDQFSARNMAARLFPPTLTEFYRLGAVIFPSGVLPSISILAISRADPVAWCTALIAVMYAGLIYVQAWTSLHQFTPAMVLPLVVFWRIYLARPQVQRLLLGAVVATTGISLLLSLPRHFEINLASREFGAVTEFRAGDYGQDYETAVQAASSTLEFLVPSNYRLQYPNQAWGLDDESWVFYVFHKSPGMVPANYIVQRDSDAAPEGTALAGKKGGFAVYVRDPELWARQRDRRLPQVIQSPLYEPILWHTCKFYRTYAARMQKKQAGK